MNEVIDILATMGLGVMLKKLAVWIIATALIGFMSGAGKYAVQHYIVEQGWRKRGKE